MSTTYVFPSRPESLDVLKRAIAANPRDANAHALLGSWYMSGGMQDLAMTEWNTARQLNPAIPALLRNMGYTALYSPSPVHAIEYFTDGTKYDPQIPRIISVWSEHYRSASFARRTNCRAAEILRRKPAGGPNFSARP